MDWTTEKSCLTHDNVERFFSSPDYPDLFWGPVRRLFNGYQGPFTWGVKQPGCETDHSPPTYTFITNTVTTLLHFLTTLGLVRQHCYSAPIRKSFSLCQWNCYLSQEKANLSVVHHPISQWEEM